ncbi:galactose-1-epimerase [Bifidobacterium sp. SMB2]|uniref:Aldose 1-epimerase n=1 Tax=Bifidobacterium saimiriisciurei TaxID=2661627 RepID=A0ABX0CCG3_9BIFI|nr:MULTISPECIES: aldose epimerase family protein [Bifidobacterium]NEG97062.1 galactose-1-epimerase [Bifidobacterium sp. SMB2]NEH12162.1 galactose-1-epimerase [Bifidobacterium saimiriisciurei]
MAHHHGQATAILDDDIRTVTITGPGGMTARLTNHGARLMSLTVPDRDGHPTDVVLGKDDPHEYVADDTLMGAIVGRNANRIQGARFAIAGREYRLAANEGTNSNHSQPNGYEHRNWTVAAADESSVEFALDSPDMDQGFPGRFRVTARYELISGGLALGIRGMSDSTTVANLTTHTYWNLNGEDGGDVLGHRLRIPAERYHPTDERFVPLPQPAASVDGTPMDFRDTAVIGERLHDGERHGDRQTALARGYNHAFPTEGTGLRLMAEATGERSGIRMAMYADAPTVLLYTAGFLDDVPGKQGHRYGPSAGLCLEPGFVPNAVNRTDCTRPVLPAGTEYRLDVLYRFE